MFEFALYFFLPEWYTSTYLSCKYNLTENYSGMTAMIFGEIYRYNGEWKFNAVGNGTTDPGLGELCQRFV